MKQHKTSKATKTKHNSSETDIYPRLVSVKRRRDDEQILTFEQEPSKGQLKRTVQIWRRDYQDDWSPTVYSVGIQYTRKADPHEMHQDAERYPDNLMKEHNDC